MSISVSDIQDLDNPHVWLNDNHINTSMALLRKQYPHVAGFQDVFAPIVAIKATIMKHIQILFVSQNHWITTALNNNSIMVSKQNNFSNINLLASNCKFVILFIKFIFLGL